MTMDLPGILDPVAPKNTKVPKALGTSEATESWARNVRENPAKAPPTYGEYMAEKKLLLLLYSDIICVYNIYIYIYWLVVDLPL